MRSEATASSARTSWITPSTAGIGLQGACAVQSMRAFVTVETDMALWGRVRDYAITLDELLERLPDSST